MHDRSARQALAFPDAFVPFARSSINQGIHQCFEAQVALHPDKVAVRDASTVLTYEQLNRACNHTVHRLLSAIDPAADPAPVAVLADQGISLIVTVLAILKAGQIYAPLDRRLPSHELSRIIDQLSPYAAFVDAGNDDFAKQLLTDRCPILQTYAHEKISAVDNLGLSVTPDTVASIFFTSGSTGLPKGVADSHRNILHNIMRYTNNLGFAPGDRMSLIQNPSFSGTMSTLFGALLNGATVLPMKLRHSTLSEVGGWLRQERITVFHSVPSIFRQLPPFADRYPYLRLIRLEGDSAAATDWTHFQRLFHDNCVLVNGLGATECGLVRQFFVNQQTPKPAAAIPIGHAVQDMAVTIADASGKALPAGSMGEIVVESTYLALGYWNNPTLTQQKFSTVRSGLRRYRTGDLGQLDADCCLTHLGRLDLQVKVAGQFVDTANIESVLSACGNICEAIVQTYQDRSGEQRLAAYLVADDSNRPTVTKLRDHLKQHIAEYAIPTVFMFLDALPLTRDGKVDRQGLPTPNTRRPTLAFDYVAPKTALEKSLSRIWSEVLEIDSAGIDDSFIDLGGDSLRASQAAVRLSKLIDAKVNVMNIFEYPTIRRLSSFLEAQSASTLAGRDVAYVASDSTSSSAWPDHSIAVIGMAGRFPGAENIAEFWENLRAARESISFFNDAVPDGGIKGEQIVAARGMLEHVNAFDAEFFGLTPRQARDLDPQQRVWLESVLHAMENAGLSPQKKQRNIGVFAGSRESSYLWHLLGGDREAVDKLLHNADDESQQLQLGNDRDSIATRTSYLFGFTGPSVNVQSACSTSLVAIAQACQALAGHQCDVAIAGGVHVSFPQQRGYRCYPGGIYSHDGHCRAFDVSATGTVISDGVGVVVLKRVKDAMADGDRLDAIIRGWAVNNDGADKASFAAPNVNAQAQVILQAQEHARVHPHDIGYIETHGTGTRVGDPIEVAGLSRAFAEKTDASGYCGIGSVKTNIGHLDAAAGVAGLIKTVLALCHGEIPASLHFQTPNPEIEFERTPFYVVDHLQSWPVDVEPRIAGVSSFGVGGTNCHLILQQAATPEMDNEDPQPSTELLTLSAKSETALHELKTRYRHYLTQNSQHSLSSITATAQISRSSFDWRLAVVAQSKQDMVDKLSCEHEAQGIWHSKERAAHPPVIGFLFNGQGSQYAGMANILFDSEPIFRRTLIQCEQLLLDDLEQPLLSVLFAEDDADALIHRTDYSHAALFAVQYALAELLIAWGIKPAFVMGHSLGEYAAACIAGVMSFEDALAFVAARGRLFQNLDHDGKMLTVFAAKEAVTALLTPDNAAVSIAAVNSPSNTVISGAAAIIDDIKRQCELRHWQTLELSVSCAFHSPLLAPALEHLQRLATRISLQTPEICLVSGLYGAIVADEITQPQYWRDHARQPVEFVRGIGAMLASECDVLVEIGPDAPLCTLVNEIAPDAAVITLPTLRRTVNDWTALLTTLGRLYVSGTEIDWPAFQQGRQHVKVKLPSYPFQRQRYWYTAAAQEAAQLSKPEYCQFADPLLGNRMQLPGSDQIRFAARYNGKNPTYLDDHRLFGVPVAPGASHFAMLVQAAPHLANAAPVTFEELYLVKPLTFPDTTARNLQLVFVPDKSGWRLQLLSTPENSEEWIVHMMGRANVDLDKQQVTKYSPLDIDRFMANAETTLSGTDFYTNIWANQGGTGVSFRWIERTWRNLREALCRIQCPPVIIEAARYRLHPGIIEAACQTLHCCETIETEGSMTQTGATYVPFSVQRFQIYDALNDSDGAAWCHAVLRHMSKDDVMGDLAILSSNGSILAEIDGFCLRQISRDRIGSDEANQASLRMLSNTGEPVITAAPPSDDANSDDTDDLLRYLQRHCEQLLGHDCSAITPNANFIQLGFDSLTAVMLANRINRDHGVSINTTQVLRAESLATLVEVINAARSP